MLVEELLKGLTGFRAYLLECHTLMTDDDTLLGVALYVDDGIDMNLTVVLLEALHDNLNGIGNLLVIEQQDFLTDNLADKEAGGLIGELVLIKEGGTLGQQFLDTFQDEIRAKLILGRDRQNLGLGQ